MESIRPALARQWKLGTLAFLIVLALCLISIWQRQARYNLVFTFSAHTITHRIRLPSLSAVNPTGIVSRLRLSLEERSLRAAVSGDTGMFTIIVDSIPKDSTDQVQERLSAIYRQVTDHFSKDVDPTPLSARLNALDARLDLIAQTLGSTALSAYEECTLEDRAVELRAQRAEVRNQLDIVSTSIFGAPTSQLYRAQQMDDEVLFVLGLVLSGFVAAATMLLADSLRRNA